MNDVAKLPVAKAAPDAGARPASEDALCACLAFLTRLYGRAYAPEQLTAGLALPDGRMDVAALLAAADRAGLAATQERTTLADLPPLALPAIVALKDGRAIVMLRFAGSDGAEVFDPRAGDATRVVPRRQVEHLAEGTVIYVRPKFYFDVRSHILDLPDTHSWFWGAVRQNWWVYAHAVLGSIAVNLLALTAPLFTLIVYDRVVPNAATDTLWVLATGVVAVAVFDFTLRMLRGYLVDAGGRRLDATLGNRLFAHVLSIEAASRPRSAGTLASTLRDFDAIRDFLGSSTVMLLADMPFILLFLLVLYLIGGPVVALTGAVAVPVVLLVALVVHFPLRTATQRSMRESTQKTALLFEVLNGLETVKAIRAEAWAKRQWEHYVALTAVSSMRIRVLTLLATNFALSSSMLLTVAIIVAGVYEVAQGNMTSGALVAAMMLGTRIMSPLSQLAAFLVRYDQMRHSFEALNRMMGLPEEQSAEANPLHVPHIKGAIEFKDVVFRYPGEDTAVLDGISFRIAAGEHVAVLGKVGSGKSTVLRLAQALYRPDQGYIRVDDLDLRQIDLDDLRRQIGYVPQDMVLFHGTVRANLVQGMPHATDEQVLRAAERTGLIEAIRKWPRGFGQPVGERGFNLSGGQRQLIALARAIIAEPPILLFDEPTSHLDNAVEKQFLDHMRDFCRGRTLLLVTHRAALMQLVDRIILIDKNKVVADGPRDDVLVLLAGTKTKAAE